MNDGIFGLAGQSLYPGDPTAWGGLTGTQAVGVIAEYTPFFIGVSGQTRSVGDVVPGFWSPASVVVRFRSPNFTEYAMGESTSRTSLALEMPSRSGAFIVYAQNNAPTNGSGLDARGNARGYGAVDIQPWRNLATEVASGLNAVAIGSRCSAAEASSIAIGGGATAASTAAISIGNNCVAGANFGSSNIAIGNSANSGSSAFTTSTVSIGASSAANGSSATAVGTQSVASGTQSVALGFQNTASTQSSVAVGVSNNASGLASTALGNACTAAQARSISVGARAVTPSGIGGSFTFNNGYESAGGLGDSAHHRVLQRRTTTDAVGVQMFSDGPSTNTVRIVLANDNSITFTVRIVARCASVTAPAVGVIGDTHCWTFTGGIKRNTPSGTVLVGTVATLLDQSDANASTWTAVVSADAGNNALVVTVTGQTNKSIQWLADWELTRTSG